MLKSIVLFGGFFFLFMLHDIEIFAQQKDTLQQTKDTLIIKPNGKADTTAKNLAATDTTVKKKKIYNPKVATLRSAIIPGWGQAYNKKYWKIPIIYGALGTTTGIFFYNLKNYKLLRHAVVLLSDTIPGNDNQVAAFVRGFSLESVRMYRNEFRQSIDYSVLFFLVFWGLNVVDANVDAHLKGFDVSPDVSMKIKPMLISGNNGPGISFVFFFKDNHKKLSLPLP